MTPVKFEFFEPDGEPLANVTFEIRMAKSGFLEPVDGIIMPETMQYTTDELGVVTVMLKPSSSLYYLSVTSPDADSDDCCAGGIKYKFYVPKVDEGVVVRVQDLIMDPPPSTTAWDEAAMLLILDAKVSSKASADAAKASAAEAKASEELVLENAGISTEAATRAEAAMVAAGDSQVAAKLSEDASKGSEDASRTSELAAAESARQAAAAQGNMDDQIAEAAEFARQSALSATESRASADNSATSADTAYQTLQLTLAAQQAAEQSAQATASDVLAVTALKGETSDFRDEAQIFRDEAMAAAGTVTGVLTDGGLVDLSSGAYPAKPTSSTIWRVTVGGTVTTVKEGTITFGIGDQLVYTLAQDVFYKIDNQQAVTSVNSRTGAVVITAADVGLANANNTSDMNKPVSNAQQVEFDKRTPTTGRVDQTAGRLTKVGDYGENGGGAIVMTAELDANAITVGGTYVFNGGGLNLPENTVYIKHIASAVPNYAKQLAYGLLTDKAYSRTQVNGVWTAWGPGVEIVDNLLSSDANKALSARQGKELLAIIQANNATIARYVYNVSAGQTTITGPDLAGFSLSYTPGLPFMVEKDGFPIWIGSDYTATTGSSIVLTEASGITSQFAITVFGAFSVADHYTKAQADVKTADAITALNLKSASKADIVGAVAQAAGVPTGAIIEYTPAGAIAGTQGDCIRYADGTQICTFDTIGAAVFTSGNGALFNSSVNFGAGQKWAKPFISSPKVSAPAVRLDGAFCVGTPFTIDPSPTNFPVFFMFVPTSNVGVNYKYSFIAIGRWY